MNKLLILSCLLIFSSCVTTNINKLDNSAFIAWSGKTRAGFTSGNGLEITIVNLDTNQKYNSKKIRTGSAYGILNNIPPGEYVVAEIVLNTGSYKVKNSSIGMRQYFGKLYIEPNKKYYLGTFEGIVRAKFKNAFGIIKTNDSLPKEIEDYLVKQNIGWEDGEFELIETISYDEFTLY